MVTGWGRVKPGQGDTEEPDKPGTKGIQDLETREKRQRNLDFTVAIKFAVSFCVKTPQVTVLAAKELL